MQDEKKFFQREDQVKYIVDCEQKRGTIISISGTVALVRTKNSFDRIPLAKLKAVVSRETPREGTI